ncbi:predicted protein [Phaeodactylum tricornutum CCAP 1055/1]|jgi:hypothetical protein|uniref:Uncharacterized protein n=2 Tax=Phaeodactylum tricornutum TaxID=2850 RepID=B7G8D5_PHATC|nr:predicted protein [Phaeodactylum tricornutum CCAP 1055/1]EEC45026.1 predicted protein [Phaeodactylum tricornutum CCAP 1055/1]|eukprot:XP_002183326.1 predicted protein [Phaeodactylum tricornutum CCAP 1055/1]
MVVTPSHATREASKDAYELNMAVAVLFFLRRSKFERSANLFQTELRETYGNFNGKTFKGTLRWEPLEQKSPFPEKGDNEDESYISEDSDDFEWKHFDSNLVKMRVGDHFVGDSGSDSSSSSDSTSELTASHVKMNIRCTTRQPNKDGARDESGIIDVDKKQLRTLDGSESDSTGDSKSSGEGDCIPKQGHASNKFASASSSRPALIAQHLKPLPKGRNFLDSDSDSSSSEEQRAKPLPKGRTFLDSDSDSSSSEDSAQKKKPPIMAQRLVRREPQLCSIDIMPTKIAATKNLPKYDSLNRKKKLASQVKYRAKVLDDSDKSSEDERRERTKYPAHKISNDVEKVGSRVSNSISAQIVTQNDCNDSSSSSNESDSTASDEEIRSGSVWRSRQSITSINNEKNKESARVDVSSSQQDVKLQKMNYNVQNLSTRTAPLKANGQEKADKNRDAESHFSNTLKAALSNLRTVAENSILHKTNGLACTSDSSSNSSESSSSTSEIYKNPYPIRSKARERKRLPRRSQSLDIESLSFLSTCRGMKRSVSFSDDDKVAEIPRYEAQSKSELFYNKADIRRFTVDEQTRRQEEQTEKMAMMLKLYLLAKKS